MTARPLYAQSTELDADNSYEGNDLDVMTGGRLLQRRLTATGNARSPTVYSHVRPITSCNENDDWRWRRLESVTHWM